MVPVGSVLLVQLAAPMMTLLVLNGDKLRKKTIVPVAALAVTPLVWTAAVNVTLLPVVDGFNELASVVLVGAGLTVTFTEIVAVV